MRKITNIIGLLFLLLVVQGNHPISGNSFLPYFVELTGSPEKIAMTPVEGGTFLRGSDEQPETAPAQEVTVSDFWMATYEITWDQFELFLYREIDHATAPRGHLAMDIDGVSGATMPYVNFNRPGYPAICMTQYAASQFCKWLTAKTGDFYRLPTEAEWEYACRAGKQSEYAIAESTLAEYAWYADNSDGQLQTGGKKRPNPWGLYDMQGNATEWVLDSYKSGYDHFSGNLQNPVYLEQELYPHVVRGGSFKDDRQNLRVFSRGFSTAAWKKQDPQFPKSLWWHTDATHVGFRIVRPLESPEPSTMEAFWINPIEEY